MATIHDDLMAPAVIVDPHTYYRGLREAAPIHYNQKWGGWVLTRYDDVVQVLKESEAAADRVIAERQVELKTLVAALQDHETLDRAAITGLLAGVSKPPRVVAAG